MSECGLYVCVGIDVRVWFVCVCVWVLVWMSECGLYVCVCWYRCQSVVCMCVCVCVCVLV